jgi:hypothetical protein
MASSQRFTAACSPALEDRRPPAAVILSAARRQSRTGVENYSDAAHDAPETASLARRAQLNKNQASMSSRRGRDASPLNILLIFPVLKPNGSAVRFLDEQNRVMLQGDLGST